MTQIELLEDTEGGASIYVGVVSEAIAKEWLEDAGFHYFYSGSNSGRWSGGFMRGRDFVSFNAYIKSVNPISQAIENHFRKLDEMDAEAKVALP